MLAPARGTDTLIGFTKQRGYALEFRPPDTPGTGVAQHLWGSLAADGPLSTGGLVSRWFALPELQVGQELAVSVAGRTGDGNQLALEFARADDGSDNGTAQPLGRRVLDDAYKDPDERPIYPTERVVEDAPQDNPEWRALHLAAAQVPADADLVRVRAQDATTDAGGWLAAIGPRIRQLEPLRPYLRQRRAVYVDPSMVWAVPCIRHGPRVTGGLAQAPTTLINPPAELGFDGEAAYARAVGGSFAGVDEVGDREVVTTRLTGSQDRPEYADWGQVVLVDYPVPRDAYDTRTTSTHRWGWEGSPALLADAGP